MNGRTNKRKQLFVAITMLGLLLCSAEAFSAINNAGIMDTVLNRFKTNASLWASIIESVATRLFWTLALISMVWTFGMMALRKADIGEFFAELIRFTVFTGFFWWLLINGPNFSISIIDSLMQVGGSAAAIGNYSGSFSPSGIVDIGFTLFGKTLGESSIWSPADSMIGIVLGLGILMLTAMIAVNMLLLLISAWILAYGGIFFLGFGGARWTHDMAINYHKTVLGIAIQIIKRVFGLVIDFGTSQSPKSTRPLTTYLCPSRPGHQALRNNFASSLLLRTWLPMTGRRVRRPTLFSLWRKARRENSAASRLLGSTSLRFALHGWQRTMILLIAIGVSLINDYYINMQTDIEFSEMAVVLIVTLTIFMLSNKVPQLLSGIITGNAPSGMGIGQFGAGAALGATTMVGAMAGAMAASGTTQGAGGVSALMAAFSQANANVAAGSDVLANAFSGSDGGDTDGGPGGGGMPGTGAPFQRHCHEGHGIFKTVLGIRLLNFSS